jgi:hypothetical protein
LRNQRAALLTATLAVTLVLSTTARSGSTEKLDGYAEFREGATIVVDGQVVRADKSTKFKKTDVRRLPRIPLGYEVKVTGRRMEDGTVVAKEVRARRNADSALDHDLRSNFDRIEQLYVARGRMAVTDPNGRVIQDIGELIRTGPMADRAMRITLSLVPPYVDPESVRVYVVDNDEWNAMAAPNYSIYVFSGLLEEMDDDEVAIVLGHELAHATHEHSRRQYDRGMWTEVGLAAAGGAAGSIDNSAGRVIAETGALLAGTAVTNAYSRDHEDQADRVGLRYAYEAGYEVSKGPQLWERFAAKYGESDKVVNFFFGDHSRSKKREQLLERELRLNYTRKGTSPSSPVWGHPTL